MCPLCRREKKTQSALCQNNLQAKQKKFHNTLAPIMLNGLVVSLSFISQILLRGRAMDDRLCDPQPKQMSSTVGKLLPCLPPPVIITTAQFFFSCSHADST
ncbi:hypothetical protein XENOCAPTIV_027731 [Xenoophorus captivus]|uniref:Uncharacterized protein n=1 Tax=Xenoophorus captivus TaxID=1517983 RepID=A0ABV0RM58_9TELE